MSNKNYFELCLGLLLENEGGWSDHKDDPGGATNKGITLETYRHWFGKNLTKDHLRDIPDEHVAKIYRRGYWNRLRADELPPGINWCVFDWAVNSGVSRPGRALQRIVRTDPDGIIGPLTVNAVKEEEPGFVIQEMHGDRERFYRSLSHFDVFGKGWLKRNDQVKSQALDMLGHDA